MKHNSTENHLKLLPGEIKEMFPDPGEVVVFSRGWDLQSDPHTAELSSYLIENDVKARPCVLEKSVGTYGRLEKSAEILVLPLLIYCFSDPNVNQVLCNLLASYIYDLVKKSKKIVRGAIGSWREPEGTLSIGEFRLTKSETGLELQFKDMTTNCHSPKEIVDALMKCSQQPNEEKIMVNTITAFVVGIDPLGKTDLSHLTPVEVLNRIRDFLSLSEDIQQEKMRSTIPVVRIFDPATTSPLSNEGSLQVEIPVDLYEQVSRSAKSLGLGDDMFHLVAVAMTHGQ